MATGNDNTTKLVWFIAGAAIGASIALLYAPAKGSDTRRKLRRRADEGRERLMEGGKEMLDRGRDLYDKGKKIADEAADLFDRGREVVQKATAAIVD